MNNILYEKNYILNIELINPDLINFDIKYVGSKNLKQLFWEAIKFPQAKCFNTIGYIKNGFNLTCFTCFTVISF
jgi:hypothetical protein